ncbi:Glycosyl transferase family 43 [Arabidopsis thaliana x Arabidopsis arenosa]|uniref:Glycosyltransferases n=1 Tax=Arabidopsis thaliana x Arabidopsis arenosa TaxID=1240361 RepID=A0A8T2A7B6_9BRAS|nr:Glycosyl transferase family 43 [Arabidopsis thaliana x Arabidopsis arenosa]
MGSLERSKKKAQVWKKAVIHFSLCFVMGFFTGFAPAGKASFFSNSETTPYTSTKSQIPPQPFENSTYTSYSLLNRTLTNSQGQAPAPAELREAEAETRSLSETADENQVKVTPRGLVIVVTPIITKDRYKSVLLRRMANTLRLVPPPLLWIVVEKHSDAEEKSSSTMLRKTGIMYRRIVFKEDFTSLESELDHQRNLALRHIEHHKLSGIVHFAGLNNIYDLDFFDKIRDIEVFGTWPMALLSANRKRVIVEGPVCESSQVLGWHLRKINNVTETKPPIHISSFAFNSSILWDPERWGRPSSVEGTKQDSIKYVKQVVLEDDTKLKGLPAQDCSKIMLWRLNFPTRTRLSP